MGRETAIALVLSILLIGTASAADLYQVSGLPGADVGHLVATGGQVIHHDTDGYLVLFESVDTDGLAEAGFDLRLIQKNVAIEELAIDGRRDGANIGEFPVLYERGEYRLYRVGTEGRDELVRTRQLFPVHTFSPKAVKPEARPLAAIEPTVMVEDLEALIALVEQDSLQSYLEHLQAYNGRVAGTAQAYTCRDWLVSKFVEFGYDSVYTDTFVESISGSPANCHNVIAYKEGSVYPDHQIVVGAHRDAVIGSPGADDNGTGTAGVLEIARILQGIDNELTFIFILFDAEEWGLYGAWHYADLAAANGDNIDYMFNLDMIGHFENTGTANLFHGSETEYLEVFQVLADSLVDITGIMAGSSGGSDHYPFQMNGYQVTFLAEYIFSSVYHSYQDSTTYINYDYFTRMTQAGLATVYQVNTMAGPRPAIAFDYPTPIPELAEPLTQTAVQVDIFPINGGTLVASSEECHYSVDGGAYTTVPLVNISGSTYEVTLPSAGCLSRFEYYFSASELGGGEFSSPDPEEPYQTRVATGKTTLLADDFESELGWGTAILGASSGQWQRGVPVNDASWAYDPATDGDGSGQCYLTQNQIGNTDVDGGSVRLTSPSFDLSEGGGIAYEYFLRMTSASNVDMLLLEINNAGGSGSWYEIMRHGVDGGLDWYHHEIYDYEIIAAGVTLTSNMVVRITANDADPQSIVEAGFDGFEIFRYDCVQPCCGLYAGGYTGNANCSDDGALTLSDITKMIDNVYISKEELCCPENGNTNGSIDGLITLSDITRLIDAVYISKDPTAPCL